ncbi:MAG: site-2 protease family protein [Candidatus Micrarchaeia archaeon]
MLVFIFTLALAVLTFLFILSLQIPDVFKFILEVLLLGVYSYYLHKRHNIEYYYGMLMLKTREGLTEIDRVARNSALWCAFADMGLVMAFGLSAPLMFRHLRGRDVAFGLLALLITALLMLPNLYTTAISVIALPYDGTATARTAQSDISMLLAPALVLGIVVLGYMAVISISLVYQAASIIISLIQNAVAGAAHNVQPGASLLLPGINLPFMEGVLALMFILFVHEMAHAVLSRVARVRLKSAGILLFGFIPVGAFVDPDEDILSRKAAHEQARVLVAGSTANFALSFIAIVLLFAVSLVPLSGLYDTGVTVIAARDGIPLIKGDVILGIDNESFASFQDFVDYKPKMPRNSTVVVHTLRGDLTVPTDQNGAMGILFQPRINPSYNWYVFIVNFLKLLFALNFFVATVNLLPIPLFDGHRLLALGLGARRAWLLAIIAGIVSLALLANILPWFI